MTLVRNFSKTAPGSDTSGKLAQSYLSGAIVAKGNSGTSTQTFVVADSPFQTVTATGNHTWAVTWPASGYAEIEIKGTNLGAYTITFPTVNWIIGDGTTSTTFSNMGVTLQASGVNTIILWSYDGGTTVYGKAA